MGAYLGAEAIGEQWTADLELPDVLTRMATELYEASCA